MKLKLIDGEILISQLEQAINDVKKFAKERDKNKYFVAVGMMLALRRIKEGLQSPKEEIEKAFKVGLEAAKDLKTENAEFELEVNYLEQYLKDNNYE